MLFFFHCNGILHSYLSLFAAEITGIAAADIVHDFLAMMLTDAPPSPSRTTKRDTESGVPLKDEL